MRRAGRVTRSPVRPGVGASFGFVERFPVGDVSRVHGAMAGMQAAGADRLRLKLSRSAYHRPGGEAWYDWLLPTLGHAFDLLPCVRLAPQATASRFAEFIALILARHGASLPRLELCLPEDGASRPEADAMLSEAVTLMRRRGVQVVLSAPAVCGTGWLQRLGASGLLEAVHAVGLRACPGSSDDASTGWLGFEAHLGAVRETLARFDASAEVWLTETGYSTWRHDEAAQVAHFEAARDAPADRMYWSDWQDLVASAPLPLDPRLHHLGVTDGAGRPKLLRRLLEAGALARARSPSRPAIRRPASPVVVLGGAGFIGSNLADSFLVEGRDVVVFDSLSRPGVERNLDWLGERHGGRVHPILADIRDRQALREAMDGADAVFHLAGQVAVTSSLIDPRHDFAVNAEGTLNVLEAIRSHAPTAPVVFASTNKVYGQLADIGLAEFGGAVMPQDEPARAGIDEGRPLDFCTPYGCSKGVADQYVLDYAHSFGLRSAVLRMSCIYGPRQFGTEDQGWVAHFLIRALRREAVTIFGDGRQVRDVLQVGDAVRAYRAVLAGIDAVCGRAFNLGGGPANAVSLHLVLAEIEALLGRKIDIEYEAWRPGDQPWFVADTRRLQQAVGWRPKVAWRDGLRDLAEWLRGDLGLADAASLPPQRLLA